MANTSIKQVLLLYLVYPPYPPGKPVTPITTKPNEVGQADYIAPYQDLEDCPVGQSVDCPDGVVATGGIGQAEVEFSLPASTFMNASIITVRVKIMNGATALGTANFNLPSMSNNYFLTTITGISAGNRTVAIDYIGNTSNVLGTCPGLATITIS